MAVEKWGDKVKTSVFGRRLGLGPNDELIVAGSQITTGELPAPLKEMPGFTNDKGQYYEFFDDFINQASATASSYHTYTSVNDGATGTNAFRAEPGGIFNLVTAAADNDYQALRTVSTSFQFLSGKPLWMDVRFRIAEATTSESTWWFGFTDTLTTGGMQANTDGPLASFDGALIYKTPETAMTVNFMGSNGATQATTSAFATSVTNTWHRCAMYFDGAATTSTITPYFSADDGVTWTQGTAQNHTLASSAAMNLIFGVKAGPTAAAETLQVDYIRVVQKR